MYSRLGMMYGCQWRFGMGMDVDPGVVFNAKIWDGRLENGRQHSHLFYIPSNSHVNVNLTHAHHEDSEISHETSMKSRIHLRKIWKSSIFLNLNLDFANFCHMFFSTFQKRRPSPCRPALSPKDREGVGHEVADPEEAFRCFFKLYILPTKRKDQHLIQSWVNTIWLFNIAMENGP